MMNKQLLIFLIRHGRTEWNKKEIFRGHLDISLDEIGKAQAEATGRVLQEVNLGIIYSSPLTRALQTAHIIKKYQSEDVKIVPHAGFLDLSYGKWEGKTHKEVRETYPELYQLWEREPHKVMIPGGETLSRAGERSWQTLQYIFSIYKGSFIGIVSHRVINKLLICKILGIDESGFWKIKQDPCCINIIKFCNGKFAILRLNDTCHISSLKENLRIKDF